MKEQFQRYWKHHKVLIIALVIMVASFLVMLNMNPGHRRDEAIHAKRIKSLFSNDGKVMMNITNIQGYHYGMLALTKIMDPIVHYGEYPKLADIRGISFAVNIFFVVAVYGVIRAIKKREDTLFIVIFLPVLFPYIFLVYTDISALTFFFFALWAHLKGKKNVAGLLMIGSMLMRQDMVVWLAALSALSVWETLRRTQKQNILQSGVIFLRKNALYAVAAILFIAFYIINDGVAVGDRHAHPSFYLGMDNIYFFLMLVVLCFAPLILYQLPKIIQLIRRKLVRIVLLIVATWFVYANTFVMDHAYNYTPGFLHNMLVEKLNERGWVFIVGYAACVLAVLALATLKLEKKKYALLLGFGVLSMALHWMIEPRYALIPLALIPLIYRLPNQIVFWQIAYGAALTGAVFWMIITTSKVFL